MRPTTRRWIFAALSAILLCIASTRLEPLNAQRETAQLVMPPLPNTVRPSMLLSPLLALGRAPIVDYLWMRATKLKEEKRYFDAYQLSQMICELQPKFASVWAFQAWNMAYNISVTCKAPEERWRWVRNGYELLRDKAIPLNPNSTQLYRELSWILFHKVGDFMDEHQDYYKLQLALQMEDVLGTPPDDYVKPGRVRGDFYREYDFKPLADAPETYEELVASSPAVAKMQELLSGFGYDISQNGVFIGLLTSLRENTLNVPNAEPLEKTNRELALKETLADPKNAETLKAIESFWRAYRLRNELKLDPKRIVKLEEELGITLDFRLAEAQGLYWANLGMEKGSDKRVNVDVHKLNTNRIEFYAMQKMFHRGRLAMSTRAKLGEAPLFTPDLRMIPILKEAFIRDSQQYLKDEGQQTPVSINFITGFIGFMRRAIIRYHEAGMQKEAQELFDYLVKTYPDPSGVYDNGLDGFLIAQFKGDRELNDYPIALARIKSLISRGIRSMVIYADDYDGSRSIRRAKQIYDFYQSNVVGERLQFPFSFAEIVAQTVHELGGYMDRESYEVTCQKLGITPLPATAEPPSTEEQ